MINLTPHEQKILDLVKKNPDVIDNPEKRKFIAEQNGLSEKTLRNRIGDLRKYGVLTSSENPNMPIIEERWRRMAGMRRSSSAVVPLLEINIVGSFGYWFGLKFMFI